MRSAIVAVCAALLFGAGASTRVSAQTTPKPGADKILALYDAHKGDFDYLLGDWEFTAESKQYGTFRGLWSAVRLDTGQILDEYRVSDEKGETIYVTTTLRNYNGALDRWDLVGLTTSNGLQDIGTGHRVGEEMQIEQRFGSTTENPSILKIRYYNIGPDRFSWTADRSADDGKTWVQKYQTIEARRIGPARSLGRLATGKKGTEAPARSTDPISGSWGADGMTFLELTLAPGATVSGTVIWRDGGTETSRGPITAGRFDATTGAVRLEGEAKRPDTGATGRYVIEGKVDKDTITGRFTFDEHTGNFTFTRK